MNNSNIIEQLPTLSLFDLRKLGVLNGKNEYRSIPITIKMSFGSGVEIYSLQVTVNTETGNSYVQLEYLVNDKPVNYRIELIQLPNPITKGSSYYFLCPFTDSKARKLYLSGIYFTHRSAIENGQYFQNTLSKSHRGGYERMKRIKRFEKTIAACSRANYKSFYDGVETIKNLKVREARAKLKMMSMSC